MNRRQFLSLLTAPAAVLAAKPLLAAMPPASEGLAPSSEYLRMALESGSYWVPPGMEGLSTPISQSVSIISRAMTDDRKRRYADLVSLIARDDVVIGMDAGGLDDEITLSIHQIPGEQQIG